MPASRTTKRKTGKGRLGPDNILTIGGRQFRLTVVFDTFWRYAAERKSIYDKRQAGIPPPWTDDPILSTTRFCNVYRVTDRASQYLIRNVIESGSLDPIEVTFRVFLWNIFTSISTYELLNRELGPLSWATYRRRTYARVLKAAKDAGTSLYTGSYQKPAPKLGHADAFMNHLAFLEVFMGNNYPRKLIACKFKADAFALLAALPGMGNFNAYQLLLDLSYTSVLRFSESDFVIAGGGALSGLVKCFASVDPACTPVSMEEELIRWLQETQDEHFARLGLEFSGLGPDKLPLQLCDIEHTLCEVEKYSRLAHPHVSGHGRPKKSAGRPYQCPDDERPQPLRLPRAWADPERQVIRIKPGPVIYQKRYVVNRIVRHRDVDGERQYRVQWMGYTTHDDTWEPAANLEGEASTAVAEYLDRISADT